MYIYLYNIPYIVGSYLEFPNHLIDSTTTRSEVKRLTKDPAGLCYSITQELFEDPVVAADGNTYEMQCIQRWLAQEERSPLTGSALPRPVP